MSIFRRRQSSSPDEEMLTIAAPMVRVSVLPFREECIARGASLCYSEELIARKLVSSSRWFDSEKGIIRFISNNSKGNAHTPSEEMFSCRPGEPVVLQIGASNGVDALAGAQVVWQDVRAIGACTERLCCRNYSNLDLVLSYLNRPQLWMSQVVLTARRYGCCPVDKSGSDQ